MNSQLLHGFNLLEKSKADILKLLSPVDEGKFNKGRENKWSLGQILIHIITSEKLALQYMRKKSLGIDALEDSGFIEPLKLALLKISQRLPIKYKAPEGIREKTPEPASKEELFQAWTNARSELKEFLESIHEKNINRKIFKHPIAGMFNVIQGIAFLREHLLHHKPQFLKLVSDLRLEPTQRHITHPSKSR
jgi:hypothetical protein